LAWTDYEATSSHSKRAHTPTSILSNDKESGFAGLTMNNSSTSNSTIASSSSHSSSNISAAPHNSSRRNTKSSISSNPNSSSSDVGEYADDVQNSSQGGSFPHRRKNKTSSGSNPSVLGKASEVTASEFLSRMDMSIEATRKNIKKSSPLDEVCETDSSAIASAILDDPSSASTSDRRELNDKNRIIC